MTSRSRLCLHVARLSCAIAKLCFAAPRLALAPLDLTILCYASTSRRCAVPFRCTAILHHAMLCLCAAWQFPAGIEQDYAMPQHCFALICHCSALLDLAIPQLHRTARGYTIAPLHVARSCYAITSRCYALLCFTIAFAKPYVMSPCHCSATVLVALPLQRQTLLCRCVA